MFKPLIAGLCGYLFLMGAGRPDTPIQAEQDADKCAAIFANAENRAKSENINAPKEALALYQQALACIPTVENHRRAKILAKISRMQLLLGEYKEAITNLEPALEMFRQISDQNADVRLEEAKVIGNLALSLKSLGRMDEALNYYEQAIRLFEDSGDLGNQAKTFLNMGLVKFLRGENEAAFSDYSQALKLCDRMDSTSPDTKAKKAEALDLMGRVYAQMNDPGQAMLHFQKALPLARNAKDYLFVGYTLNDIGALRRKQNQALTAERYHQKALSELKEKAGDANGAAEAQSLLADAQTAQGKYDAARKNYHEALDTQRRTQDIIGQAQTYFSMGMLESRAKNWPGAEESLAQATELYRQVHHRVGESNSRFRIAEVLAAEGRRTEAGREAEQAITLAEEVRTFTPGANLRASYFASLDQMYRFQIDLLLSAQSPGKDSDKVLAFDRFQRAQSRTLLDTLQSKVGTENLRARDPEAARKKGDQERKLAGLLNASVSSATERETFESVRKLEIFLKAADAQLLADDPKLGIFSEIASAQDVQRRILGPDSALIQFYLSDLNSYAWIITRSTVQMVGLPSKKTLESYVRRALQFGPAGDWMPSQQAALASVRRSLAPVFAAAPEKRWIVVPDGELHYFPFTLLTSFRHQDQGPKEVIKIPSASAIDVVRRTSHAAHPTYALAIFADPVFDKLDSGVQASKAMRSPSAQSNFLPRLLHTSNEAAKIAMLFPPGQSRSWLRFAATKEAASGTTLQDFQNIHLATHSIVDENNPDNSRIVLSRVSENGKPRSGNLFLKDIYKMKLSADLVVLSSCQSALGRQQAGEGPISLSRAFLFAGAKSVVASLWEVNDDATGELMQEFYRYMRKKNLPPSTALAQAQADFRKHPDKRLRNPIYWAGFELYGDWIVR